MCERSAPPAPRLTAVPERIQKARSGVSRALAGRDLVWFGIRGEDGEALAGLPELAGGFSIIAPMRGKSRFAVDVCLERLRGSRPDLDRYDVDLDGSEAAAEFGRQVLREVQSRPCVLTAYRASALLTAFSFATPETMTLAGPCAERQAAFEHKPWVERELRRRGVDGLPWRYFAQTDVREPGVTGAVAVDRAQSGPPGEEPSAHPQASEMLAQGVCVLRTSHTSGGVGVALARDRNELADLWPQGERLVAVAPYQPGAPVNFSGCVFADGQVRMHPPSLQLLGIASCTDRRFGYCGNDFAELESRLGRQALDSLDELGGNVGRWLSEQRYVGAFGVDAIVHAGRAIFAEMNPRLQGSTAVSALIARELGMPDLLLDHLAACLHLEPSCKGLTLGEWAQLQPEVSRIVLHNRTGGALARRDAQSGDAQNRDGGGRSAALECRGQRNGGAPPAMTAGAEVSQLAPAGLPVEPGGTLCSLTVRRAVTDTGTQLHPDVDADVRSLRSEFQPAS